MSGPVGTDSALRVSADPALAYDEFEAWAAASGVALYPHQAEALLELASGSHVILATPTGSGKSLVATGAIAFARARGERAYYTAPIKALVSEKFFALCEVFGADQVGLATGDATVNPDDQTLAAEPRLVFALSAVTFGVAGGFLLGWGVMLWCLSTWVYDAAPEAVRRSVVTGVLSWFCLDSAGSIASGYPTAFSLRAWTFHRIPEAILIV